MNQIGSTTLKVVLALVGAYIIFIGIDFGFGGFKTLGWQGSGATDFVQISDAARYGVQDSHFRFLGGIMAAMGVLMLVAVTNLPKYHQGLKGMLALIVAGGIMRLTSGDGALLFGAEIGAALFAEIGLASLLYVWLAHVVKTAG
ncbi:MAG: DUF4345 domain-containing protein [Herpetosiphonaceae bacterium]|nr:DUF4345 domain-containing protein [Herpetosiphonaceae bacterium]